MIYTLTMSTADRYTHQRLPVLRDLAGMLRIQTERVNRNDMEEEMANDGKNKGKRSNLMTEMSMGNGKPKRVRGKPSK